MRDSALRPSTVFWALSIALVTIFASMGTSSGRALPHHPVHGAGGEQAHQIVLQGEKEPALPRIALPARPPPQLVVDPAALVALAAQHVETAERADLLTFPLAGRVEFGLDVLELGCALFGGGVGPPGRRLPGRQSFGITPEDDVDASPGHVGGHGHPTDPAGLGDDLRLTEVLLGVEDLVGYALLLEEPGEVLGLGHRCGAHQHRLALRRGARRCHRPRRRTWRPPTCR